jgi:hypothetical protein
VKIVSRKGIEHENIIAKPNTLTTHSLSITKASDFSLLKVHDSP